MILSIEQIKDYQYCPMLYQYNHVLKVKPPKTTVVDKFAIHSLKQSFYWYFHEQQDGKTPSIRELRKKFGSLFMFDRTYSETMFLDMRSRARTLETRAVKSLTNFNEIYSKDLGVPLLINTDYSLELNDVKVTGTIPVIRETQYKDVELVSFTDDIINSPRANNTYKTQVQRDIDIIASSMAFKKIYGWDIDSHFAYSMYHGDVFTCKVDGPLMLNFEKIVTNVAKAIDNDVFYPVYNSRCSTCAYRQRCLKEW